MNTRTPLLTLPSTTSLFTLPPFTTYSHSPYSPPLPLFTLDPELCESVTEAFGTLVCEGKGREAMAGVRGRIMGLLVPVGCKCVLVQTYAHSLFTLDHKSSVNRSPRRSLSWYV